MNNKIAWLALAIALIVLAAIMVRPANQIHIDKKETAFERVMRTGTIRCGYAVWYPEIIKDPNTGALSGYEYDVMNAIGGILGLKIVWAEEIGWGVAQDGLMAQRYDIACNGYWGPPARAKTVLPSIPFVYTPLFVVVGDKTAVPAQGFVWLNDSHYKVGTIRGTAFDILISQKFPLAKSVDAAELSNDGNILLDVIDGKVDFALSNYTSIQRFLEQNHGGVKIVEPAVGMMAGTFYLPRGDYDLKSLIDYALSYMINNGQIDVIMKKYMGDNPKAWLLPTPSYLSPQKTPANE